MSGLVEVQGNIWDLKQVAGLSVLFGADFLDLFTPFLSQERGAILDFFRYQIEDLSEGQLRQAQVLPPGGFCQLYFEERNYGLVNDNELNNQLNLELRFIPDKIRQQIFANPEIKGGVVTKMEELGLLFVKSYPKYLMLDEVAVRQSKQISQLTTETYERMTPLTPAILRFRENLILRRGPVFVDPDDLR